MKSLINVDDSCLIVIDVQQNFLDKLPAEDGQQLVKRIVWLANVALSLGVPLVVTAEDIARNGSVIPELEQLLPAGVEVHNKLVFGLAGEPDILRAVRDTKRNTAVLVGLETDVCVAHSAIGLLEQGYQVVVVQDATASPGKAHEYGLARMQAAGVLVSDVKSLFYEWLRTVPRYREFHSRYKGKLGDPGLTL